MSYFFMGQGKVFVATLSSGVPGGFRFLGNCSMVGAKLGAHMSRYAISGGESALKAARIGEPPGFTMNMEEFSSDNLALISHAVNTAIATATVTDEAVIGHVGLMTPLAYINLDSFTSLKHVSGTPTYALNTDYTVNTKAGSITIPVGSTITDGQSLKASYVRKASTKIAPGTYKPAYLWIRVEGINVANGNDSVVFDMFKCRFHPIDELKAIDKSFVSLSLTGRLYYSSVSPANDTTDGRFIRIRKV